MREKTFHEVEHFGFELQSWKFSQSESLRERESFEETETQRLIEEEMLLKQRHPHKANIVQLSCYNLLVDSPTTRETIKHPEISQIRLISTGESPTSLVDLVYISFEIES